MKTSKYVNREISWLRFNARVLQEAMDDSVPLIERLRFLGIYSNNLDEFYAVRYAAILRAIQLESKGYNNIIENQTNTELVEQINALVKEQQVKYNETYDKIFAALEKRNIFLVDADSIPEEHIDFVRSFYEQKLSYAMSIFILDKKSNAPAIRDGSLNLAIHLHAKAQTRYALIEVPTKIFPRFIVLPKIGDKSYIIYLEDIIRIYLADIFRNFEYDSITAHSVKITRDAQLDMDNDVYSSFLETVSRSVEDRKRGEPVRIVYDREISQDTVEFIMNIFGFDSYDSIIAGGKYHNKSDLMSFPNLGGPDLEYAKIIPLADKRLQHNKDYFQLFSEKDHLIHAPYQDYSDLLKFLQQAAIDPLVEKMKITIYRAAKNSQIMRALINAARNGKSVTVVLELRARFDESNNVSWSKALQEAGVKVIFGVPGLKVHSKVGYIERQPQGNKSTRYTFVSTGNFNEDTARFYTDYTLITAHLGICKEVKQLFDFFDANYMIQSYKHIILSPLQTRKKLSKLIRKEIKNHQKGLPAQINIKLNSLSDKKMIDLLYEASMAGVEVRLIVRGIHSLKPNIVPFSQNITSVSVVDKFLEHPRIFWFKNAGEDKVFISSADFMERNLDHRIELSVPIYDPDYKEQIQMAFDLNFTDNKKARLHGTPNEYQTNASPSNRSQFTIYDYLKSIHEN